VVTSAGFGSGQVAARPARVIEFIGLPGAGKTTAARRLAERLAEDEARTVIFRDIKRDISRLPKLKRVEVVARADRRIWTAAYHGFLAPLSSHRWSKRIRGPFQVADYFLAIDRENRSTDQERFLFLEDWIVQSLWRACCIGACRLRRAKELIEYHARCFDVSYVFFDIDPETSAVRIFERAEKRKAGLEKGWTNFEKLELHDCVAVLRARREVFVEMISFMRDRNIKTLTVDGRCAPEQVSGAIRAALAKRHA
jgi:thymidylate kinase